MELITSVIHCCGMSGFFDIPPMKKQFKQEALKRINNGYGIAGVGNFKGELAGSFIILTTNSVQTSQERYLPELGFRRVARQVNTNSGNKVSLWVMSRNKFNRKLKEWAKEF